ncbi:MAG TPA: thiamine phosphate synthase [Pyrinomonadaceae bacterium]|jgi:thiamine-phosphate pyrophosphorylase|nr:thiamine phosphate synthase [Pyrinomonadaceae bacterium]
MPPLKLQPPIICLITSGETTPATNPDSEESARLLALCAAAVAARVSLIQLREKNLSARTLFELSERVVRLTRGSATRLLVNDRADIARAAGADGVHLTTRSLDARVVRRAFGDDFLIGVSAHSLAEARAARDLGADFATFGPVFDTPSKRAYGPPVGLAKLNEAASALAPFALLALGGITSANAPEALRAGAQGIAAIRLFSDAHALPQIVRALARGHY